MKSAAVLIILILLISVSTPLSVQINLICDEAPVLIKLNVCHTSGPALSGGIGQQSFYEAPDSLSKPVVSGVLEINDQTYSDLISPLQEEKPPRA